MEKLSVFTVRNAMLVPDVSVYIATEEIPDPMKKDMKVGSVVALALVKDPSIEEVKTSDLYPIGMTAEVVKAEQNGLLLKTTDRVALSDVEKRDDGVFVAKTRIMPVHENLDTEAASERLAVIKIEIMRIATMQHNEASIAPYLGKWSRIEEVVSGLSAFLPFDTPRRYRLLEADSAEDRTQEAENMIREFLQMNEVITEAVQQKQDEGIKTLRENALKQQIQLLQDKLDELDPESVSDIRQIEDRIEKAGMNETAYREARKALHRMKQEGKNGHDYAMLYDYLDFLTGLEWNTPAATQIELDFAEKTLDEDHFGLEKVKQRIIAQIAVMNLKQQQSGSILLFVGAPGTGKTSIGQSISKALGRKYMRISLGGVRDEADIRGHRRTYVGAMPGRIMDGISKSGASNPVIVLDEIDKLSVGFNGDPASALLEALDPEQNFSFTDHYMNVPYDLSNVMFICTANTLETIPDPLLNRMEVINFPGYTHSDKVQIAKRHLLPRSMESMGISKKDLKMGRGVIDSIIDDFTLESGVRGLKRQLDTLCRIAAVNIVKGEGSAVSITKKNLRTYLDDKPIRHGRIKSLKLPGVATGLAWTPSGGDVLFIETAFVPGDGRISITGQLGSVMKESAQIAISLVKNIYPGAAALFKEYDLHIHVPAGSVKKDGPSAGITLLCALASLVTGTVAPPRIAMTGEISLRGEVMAIGGLPEKLMAAQRAGAKTVLIPHDNIDDLDDVAEEIKEKLEIIPVETVGEVLAHMGLDSVKQ